MRVRSVNGVLALLAFTTGATDATAFERLGHAFASVITGNLVLVAVGAAQGNTRLTLLSASALVAYGLGVLAAAPRLGPEQPPQNRVSPEMIVALLAALGLLIGVTVAWELAGGHPGSALQVVLLAGSAGAMGIQSTAIRRLGAVSTTYLTSTYVGLLEAVAGRDWSPVHLRSLAILLAALAGAGAATPLLLHAPRLAALPVIVPLAAAIGLAIRSGRR
jgi:uncharacterized membrane protein YoaK (UPF0700 family)